MRRSNAAAARRARRRSRRRRRSTRVGSCRSPPPKKSAQARSARARQDARGNRRAGARDRPRSGSAGIGATLPAFTKPLQGDDLNLTATGETASRSGGFPLSSLMSSRRDHTVSFALPAGSETARSLACTLAVKSLLLVACSPGSSWRSATAAPAAAATPCWKAAHQRLVRRQIDHTYPRPPATGRRSSTCRSDVDIILEREGRHRARPARCDPEGQRQRPPTSKPSRTSTSRTGLASERGPETKSSRQGRHPAAIEWLGPSDAASSPAAAAHPRGRGLPAPGRGGRELRQPAPARAPAAAASVAGADWFRPVVALASGPRNLPLES